MGTLHSDEVAAPREPKGSLVAPLNCKMSRTSKFVSTPALACKKLKVHLIIASTFLTHQLGSNI